MSNAATSKRYVERVWNERDCAAIDEYLAENVVVRDPFAGEQTGRASQLQFVQGMLAAFPDVRATIEGQLEVDDIVVTDILFRGTNTGPLTGRSGILPPTNRVAEVSVTVEERYENGQIVEAEAFWDPQDMLRQLGVG